LRRLAAGRLCHARQCTTRKLRANFRPGKFRLVGKACGKALCSRKLMRSKSLTRLVDEVCELGRTAAIASPLRAEFQVSRWLLEALHSHFAGPRCGWMSAKF
jgi:hypothetical protein